MDNYTINSTNTKDNNNFIEIYAFLSILTFLVLISLIFVIWFRFCKTNNIIQPNIEPNIEPATHPNTSIYAAIDPIVPLADNPLYIETSL